MNNFKQKKIVNTKQRRLIVIAAVFFIFFCLIEAVVFSALKIESYYQDKFFPGIYIGQIKAGGKTQKEVYELLEKFKEELSTKGLTYVYPVAKQEIAASRQEDEIVNIMPQIYAVSDPDLSYEIITINLDATIAQAFALGRHKNLKNILPVWRERYRIWQNTKTIPLNYKINQEELLNILKDNFKKLEIPPGEARFLIDQNFKIHIEQEKFGLTFDYQQAVSESETKLKELNLEPIAILSLQSDPKIKRNDLVELISQAESLLNNAEDIQLENETQQFEIKPIIYKNWLSADKQNKTLTLNFNNQALEKYLEQEIKPKIDQGAAEPKFIIGGNKKVSEFTPSQPGLKLNLSASREKINQEFFKNPDQKINLVIEIIPPQYSIASINDLGISELLGAGVSNFKGSPPNRRHNIAVGAASLNGILVPPGEEFSTNKALGAIDAQTGYLTELVIKGNKTIPEYGGGLCQVGTTLFRAALAAGLPITERKAHSYRVVYYEPAGTDCTVYSPHPDCRFLNDSKNYILIQTKVKGDDLFFEFWGTKDGRQITQTDPIVSNITNPASTKYIETEDLEPGQIKCIESAHKGADTEFIYTIKYPDGQLKEQEFKSHYKPWQAVCLVGKKKLEQEEKQE